MNKYDQLIDGTQFYCCWITVLTLVLNLTPIFSVNFDVKALKFRALHDIRPAAYSLIPLDKRDKKYRMDVIIKALRI